MYPIGSIFKKVDRDEVKRSMEEHNNIMLAEPQIDFIEHTRLTMRKYTALF